MLRQRDNDPRINKHSFSYSLSLRNSICISTIAISFLEKRSNALFIDELFTDTYTHSRIHSLTHAYADTRPPVSNKRSILPSSTTRNAGSACLIHHGSQSTILLDIYLCTRELTVSPSDDLWQDAYERDDLFV